MIKAYLPVALHFLLPYIALSQAVPVNNALVSGKLQNGLTYYILQNAEPKARASFYLVQSTGSLVENEHENGLAHFLEHMAFKGTLNFPGNQIIKLFEKYGVAFGRNINAATSFNETVYKLSNIPVKNEGIIDTCLLVLADWAQHIALHDSAIDAERRVIEEEIRSYSNVHFRLQKKINPVIFRGSEYANNTVIGSEENIRNFGHETIRSFYKKWYRPGLQAIIVVGDLNISYTENKIHEIFKNLVNTDNKHAIPFFEIPTHGETLFVEATDKEISQYSISLTIKHESTPPDKKDENYLRQQILRKLFNLVMNERMADLLRQAKPPFITGSIEIRRLVAGYDALSLSAVANPKQTEQAFEAIYAEAFRVVNNGIMPEELERARANYVIQIESNWKQKDKIQNDTYAQRIQAYFLSGEPFPDADKGFELRKSMAESITQQEINRTIRTWFSNENRVIVISGPEGTSEDYPSLDKLLVIMEFAAGSEISAEPVMEASGELVTSHLIGSAVIKTRQLPVLGAVEWTLANNARVVYRFADFQKDQISIQAISNGGYSLYDTRQLAAAQFAAQFASYSGLGNFDAGNLQKVLAGKNATIIPIIQEYTENIIATGSPSDLEVLFKLLYLTFEHPRFDEQAFESLKNRLQAALASSMKNPQKAMMDSLSIILSNNHERIQPLTAETFDSFNLQDVEQIYRDRFKDAGDFIFFVVGNKPEKEVKVLVEQYIGSFQDHPRKEQWKDNKIRLPKGLTNKTVELPMQDPKALIVMVAEKQVKTSPKNNLTGNILQEILRVRLIEKLRDREGATYGVSVAVSGKRIPRQTQTLQISLETKPDYANRLRSLIADELYELGVNGLRGDELANTVKLLREDSELQKMNNSYWLASLIAYYETGFAYNNPKYFDQILAKLKARDIQRYVRRLMKRADQVHVTFLPQLRE